MAYRQYKDVPTLAYDANVKHLRNVGSIILADVLNEAIREMTEDFKAALSRGEVKRIEGTRDELREFFRRAAERELGPVKGGARALPGKK